MTCRDMDRLIQLYVDQEIEEQERSALHQHVAVCTSCRESLTEMIALVSSLEEIRTQPEHNSSGSVFVNYLVKWVAIYTAVFFIIATSPSILTHHTTGHEGGEGRHSQENILQQSVVVFATSKEQLPIPDIQYVKIIRPRYFDEEVEMQTAWVYPSAVPLLTESRQEWMKRMKRLVLVKVPDNQTFARLLASLGISSEHQEGKVKKFSFPISVMVTTGENPEWETFDFPENEQHLLRWFDKFAATSALP